MATRNDQRGSCPGGARGAGGASREEVPTRSVLETNGLDRLMEQSLPAFGAAFLRRVWLLLDEAVGRGVPMTLAVSGPVTLSGQTYTWLAPLLDTGWFCLVSTTDAVCYHDGHRALDGAAEHPIHQVPIWGDDGQLREDEVIRVTDLGFDEAVLLDQDAYLQRILRGEEFQRRMSGTEFRNLLGRHYAELEAKNQAREGLMALCHRMAIPVFVGAPADGSVFLNSMRLWALARTGGPAHRFELDLHEEVFESCAYHWWGLGRESDAPGAETSADSEEGGVMGTLILGGGVPKNFNLQPEPALSQILGLENVRGYLYDIQLTTAPITDGSLSSCPPAEAVTWGKVDKDSYRSTCESFQCDYTVVMPFLVKALLDKRARFERLAAELGQDTLFERHPEARGYLRDRAGYRLFERREELLRNLTQEVRRHGAAPAGTRG